MSSYTPTPFLHSHHSTASLPRAHSSTALRELEYDLIARSRQRDRRGSGNLVSPKLFSHGEHPESEAQEDRPIPSGGGRSRSARNSFNGGLRPFLGLTGTGGGAGAEGGFSSVPHSRRQSPNGRRAAANVAAGGSSTPGGHQRRGSSSHRPRLLNALSSSFNIVGGGSNGGSAPNSSQGRSRGVRKKVNAAGELLTGNASLFYLAGLTDDKGGSYEKYRVDEETMNGIKKKKIRKFYERQNEVLDGFAEVDRIIDSTHSLTASYYRTASANVDLYETTPVLPAHRKSKSSASNYKPNLTGTSTLTADGRTGKAPRLRRRRSRESSDWSSSSRSSSVSSSRSASPVRNGRGEDMREAEADEEAESGSGSESGSEREEEAGERTKLLHVNGGSHTKGTQKSVAFQERSQNGNGSGYGSTTNGVANANLAQVDLERAALERDVIDDVADEEVEGGGDEEEEGEFSPAVKLAIWVNLAVNIALMLGKVLAAILSNSISVIASLVDSAMDLLSNLIIVGTTRAIENKDWRINYMYPVGKKRMEPMGVVIFSVFMIASFVQVLLESIQRLAKEEKPVNVPLVGLIIMASTIGIKIFIWFWCRSMKSTAVQALAQDAENDVVFNAGSIFFPFLGQLTGQAWLDPLGGVILSLYIIIEWIQTLYTNVSNLTGRRATPHDHQRIVYLITRFSPIIKAIQHVEVYHMGDQFIVEVDIVLPAETSLPLAHNVGESVQYALECLDGVERAYVHVDFSSKNPSSHVRK